VTTTAAEDTRQPLLAAIEELQDREQAPSVRIALAEAKFRLAMAAGTEPDEALALLNAATKHDPFCPKLFLHRGRLLHQSGRPGAALSEYRHVIRLAPASRRAHLLLALALLDLGPATRELGDLVIAGLSSDNPADLKAAVADVDAWLAEQAAPEPAGERKPLRPASVKSGAPDVWRVALYEQLVRGKAQPAQLKALLDTGLARVSSAGEIAEYATACVLLLAGGQQPQRIQQSAKAILAEHAEHPAVALLDAGLRLAQAPGPAEFAELAAEFVERDVLPVELVCAFHLANYGPARPGTAADALALLEQYPESIRDTECFAELKLAVLDGHARNAWATEQFAEARLLWQEAALIDRFRVPLALNLALLAARTKSAEDYGAAWGRLGELLYLHAAGVGNVQLMLTDRRTLHLALAQQAQLRHCGSSSPRGTPAAEEIDAWLADADALTEWLDQWDLYYLNARLGFRSPVHLLGVSPGTGEADLKAATDAFAEHVRVALDGRDWAGINVFAGLAAGAAQQAHDAIAENESRDQYYESERADAQALAEAALNRGLTLRLMMTALTKRSPDNRLRLGYDLARRQLALPWQVLRPICVERGLISDDIDLVALFQDDLISLTMRWNKPEPESEEELADRLSVLDDCVTLLPERLDVRLIHCQALHAAGREADAYAAAVAALRAPVTSADHRDALVSHLVGLVDEIGMLAVPESVRSAKTPPTPEVAIAALRKVLEQFPQCGRMRCELAALVARYGAGPNEAIKLLREGLESSLSPQQRREFADQLAKIESDEAATPIRESIHQTVEAAKATAHTAIKAYTDNPGAANSALALASLRAAIGQVTEGLRMAEQARLGDEAAAVRKVLSWLRHMVDQVNDAEPNDEEG
jgi:tetratricopeptide (TPR) repeat protein